MRRGRLARWVGLAAVVALAGVAPVALASSASASSASASSASASSASASSASASTEAALPTDGLKYVAIGDSYSSGLGVGEINPDVPSDCGQSLQNFPHQLAATLGLDLTDVTCSGAQAENLTTVPQPVNGTTVPVQTAALDASTDVVTISVGGNGLKFTTVAAACAAATPNGPLVGPGLSALTSCQQIPAIAALPARIPLLGQVIGATYAAVRAAAPNAKVFVLGYPSIAPDAANLPASGSCFSPVTLPGGFPFTDADTPFLHTIEEALDDTVQDQAVAAGFTYVPTFGESLAHSACAPAATSYVNGVFVDFTVPTAPVVEEKSLHPNANGVDFMARLAETAVADAFPVTSTPPPTPTPTPTAAPTAAPTVSPVTPDPTATVAAHDAAPKPGAGSGALAATGVFAPMLIAVGVFALLAVLAGVGMVFARRRILRG
ncbi:hypothetical protein B7R54_06055 [Subtercola boreus]|uniref:SGNH hydrolase-type esterase domain-containing protein n=1 Tax=Subtercola boreus TaxID=120213 RepID=A0A3E0VFV7_9MICO|nr:SGNH/GDSL hydrolase family protein [Subtercola boreus]RFA08836.1 hypothetical protein B7R54_06055 [Subtercola boreus]